jgi:hypothetical protein
VTLDAIGLSAPRLVRLDEVIARRDRHIELDADSRTQGAGIA